MRAFSAVLLAALAAPVFGDYTWYFTDPMQSFLTNDWTSNATPQFNYYSGGYWGGYGGTMVSSVRVPDGTSSYSVQARIHFPNGLIQGNVSLLLRASGGIGSGGLPNTGYVVTFSCSPGSNYINLQKVVNGTVPIPMELSRVKFSKERCLRADGSGGPMTR